MKGNAKDEAPKAPRVNFSNLDLQMANFGAFWGQVCAFRLHTPESDSLD